MTYELHLEDNIYQLCEKLKTGKYLHARYKQFIVVDNKKRQIHKAEVQDRIVHQIIHHYLLSHFEPDFIADSYASRTGKGQYRAISAFRYFVKLASGWCGFTYVLKCDIKKYFDSVDHHILLALIKKRINDQSILKVIEHIIRSYNSMLGKGKGIPLGNITSQIFANIYLDVLDKYIKNDLGCRFYLRYNDDIIIVSRSREKLVFYRNRIMAFAKSKLSLEIPHSKTTIRKISWGVDFLGYTILPKAVLLRNKTKLKIKVNIHPHNLNFYLGILEHCNCNNLRRKLFSLEKVCQCW